MRLDKVGPTLIRQGTYFAVEKARSLAIRQLFRKVYVYSIYLPVFVDLYL